MFVSIGILGEAIAHGLLVKESDALNDFCNMHHTNRIASYCSYHQCTLEHSANMHSILGEASATAQEMVKESDNLHCSVALHPWCTRAGGEGE